MSVDMKYEMQMIAEEIAEEEYGKEFYDLPQDERSKVYGRAEDEWMNRAAIRADMLNDMAREQ